VRTRALSQILTVEEAEEEPPEDDIAPKGASGRIPTKDGAMPFVDSTRDRIAASEDDKGCRDEVQTAKTGSREAQERVEFPLRCLFHGLNILPDVGTRLTKTHLFDFLKANGLKLGTGMSREAMVTKVLAVVQDDEAREWRAPQTADGTHVVLGVRKRGGSVYDNPELLLVRRSKRARLERTESA
jgi:hypothetical protein